MRKEKDKCIVCGVKTPYDKDEHVEHRHFYVVKAGPKDARITGQLCEKCWIKVYKSTCP